MLCTNFSNKCYNRDRYRDESERWGCVVKVDAVRYAFSILHSKMSNRENIKECQYSRIHNDIGYLNIPVRLARKFIAKLIVLIQSLMEFVK